MEEKKLEEIVSLIKTNRVVVLGAIGGIGKSTLARNIAEYYLHTKKKQFDAIVWISGKTEDIKFNEVINKIADVLGYYEKISGMENFAAKVNELSRILGENKILFIFDNYETINDDEIDQFIRVTIPNNNRIIITTRHTNEQFANDQVAPEIEKLDKIDGFEVIENEFNKNQLKLDSEIVERIYNLTEGLPQAIVWAVAQLKHHITIDMIENAAKNGMATSGNGEELFGNLFDLSWKM